MRCRATKIDDGKIKLTKEEEGVYVSLAEVPISFFRDENNPLIHHIMEGMKVGENISVSITIAGY